MLTIREAEMELKTGAGLTPGPWEQHSRSVGENARRIAEKIPWLNPDKAYVFGLMHDIGRRFGIRQILHIFEGYEYMLALGHDDIARICLTHSFPLKNADTYIGRYDCTPEQKAFLEAFLQNTEYDDYDLLIQLCDAISLPVGACIMEKRLVDVALRHGLPDFTLDKWKAFMNIKKHFDELCRCNIYSLLPNVLENSSENLF